MCQLFVALDFSYLKEVEEITTNPYNQNVLEFGVRFVKKHNLIQDLAVKLRVRQIYLQRFQVCKDISIFFLPHYFQGTKALLKRFSQK